eukprot:sb/3472189/
MSVVEVKERPREEPDHNYEWVDVVKRGIQHKMTQVTFVVFATVNDNVCIDYGLGTKASMEVYEKKYFTLVPTLQRVALRYVSLKTLVVYCQDFTSDKSAASWFLEIMRNMTKDQILKMKDAIVFTQFAIYQSRSYKITQYLKVGDAVTPPLGPRANNTLSLSILLGKVKF